MINKEQAADLLQNDISQTLSAVLLWMQTAMAEDQQLALNMHLRLAEGHLKDSVKKLVRLHYALLSSNEEQLPVRMPLSDSFVNKELFERIWTERCKIQNNWEKSYDILIKNKYSNHQKK